MQRIAKRILPLFLALFLLLSTYAVTLAAGSGTIRIASKDAYLNAAIDLTNCPAAQRPQYRIYDARGDVVTTVTAGTDGTAVASNLDVGSYEVEQISAAPGYSVVTSTFTVAVTSSHTASSPATLDFACAPTAVSIEKVDASDKSPLAGVAFQVRASGSETPLSFAKRADGNYVYVSGMYTALADANASGSVTTDAEGKIAALYLPVDVEYTLMEADVSDRGFRTADSQTFTVHDDNNAAYPVQIGVENWPLYLSVTKKDSETNTPIANSNVQVLGADDQPLHFTLTDDGSYRVTADGLTQIPTGSNGTVLISHIPTGAYAVVDVPATGYGNIPNIPVTVTQDALEATPATAAVNSQATCVRILVKDKLTGQPIANAKLTVSGEGVAEQAGTSGADGTLTVKHLPVGSYTAKQEQILGYAPMADKPFTVTASHVLSAPLAVTLENDAAVVEITVKDGVTSTPITKATYNLLDAEGKPVSLVKESEGTYRLALNGDVNAATVFASNGSGVIVLHGNTNGMTIHMATPESGKGYTPDTKITLTNVAVNKIALTALPTAMQIKSVVSGTQTALPGATYSVSLKGESTALSFKLLDGKYVYDATGTVKSIALNSSAEAVIYGLPEGKYKITETTTPTGYFPVTAKNVTLQASNTSESPLSVVIQHSKEIKLGLDSDRYDVLIVTIGAAVVLTGAGLAAVYAVRKRRKNDAV